MEKFHFACLTEIFFGHNCVLEQSAVFRHLGKRAYVVSSKFPKSVENLALNDIKTALRKEGIEYEVNDEAQSDPPVESIVKIQRRVMEYNPDFLISVGGGSAMDTVKAVNMLLKRSNENPYVVLYGDGPRVFTVGGPDDGALPIVSVPTTAGTGSEIAGVAVLTRNDINNKAGTNAKSYATYAFVDSKYISSASHYLNCATALDALCHSIEIYLSKESRCNFMTNMLCEASFHLFSDFKEKLLLDTEDAEDYDKQMLFSLLQGIVITNEATGVPHGMGYPLSYYYHVPHGMACGMLEGEYLKIFDDQKRVEQMLDLLGFKNVDEFCEYLYAIISPHVKLRVSTEEIEDWTRIFMKSKWRVDRHPEVLSEDKVRSIYRKSFERFNEP